MRQLILWLKYVLVCRLGYGCDRNFTNTLGCRSCGRDGFETLAGRRHYGLPAAQRGKAIRSTWTLESGLEVARELEALLAPIGMHVAIGGGVMLRGEYGKDLDLILFPHCSTGVRQDALVTSAHDLLDDRGWVQFRTTEQMHRHWRAVGSQDVKQVEVWLDSQGRRVDLIFLW